MYSHRGLVLVHSLLYPLPLIQPPFPELDGAESALEGEFHGVIPFDQTQEFGGGLYVFAFWMRDLRKLVPYLSSNAVLAPS